MKKMLMAMLMLAACSGVVQAAEPAKACLIEGTITMMGTTTEIKDCLQNKNTDPKKFLAYCENIVEMGTNMAKAGGAENPEPKVSYLSECPKPAQASCDTGMIAFYYKRDADMLAASKKSCEYNHGKWAQ